MSSYEKNANEKFSEDKSLPPKIELSVLKYFWQSSPLSGARKTTVPKFLRKVSVFRNFSDNELRILSRYLHLRTFSASEFIFKQDDSGFGFYLVMNGQVNIRSKSYSISRDGDVINKDETGQENINHIATLEKYDYFGELALLEENSIRTASAVATENTILLGIFKPDMDELIDVYPVVGAKLLQSISMILADRLSSVTNEMKILKYRISQYEEKEQTND